MSLYFEPAGMGTLLLHQLSCHEDPRAVLSVLIVAATPTVLPLYLGVSWNGVGVECTSCFEARAAELTWHQLMTEGARHLSDCSRDEKPE